MKQRLVFTSLLLQIIILSIRCSNKNEEGKQIGTNDIINNEGAIKPILVDQIKFFLAYNDSLHIKNHTQFKDVYWVIFQPSEDSSCNILIATQPAYNEKDFIGYSMIDGQLIAFYNKYPQVSDCITMFVTENKLIKEPNSYYRDSKSDYGSKPYEPIIRELKVYSSDSIAIVGTFPDR